MSSRDEILDGAGRRAIKLFVWGVASRCTLCPAGNGKRFVKHEASRARIGDAILRFCNVRSIGSDRSDHVLQAIHIPAKRAQRIRARVRVAYPSAYMRADRLASVREGFVPLWTDSEPARPCFHRPLGSD